MKAMMALGIEKAHVEAGIKMSQFITAGHIGRSRLLGGKKSVEAAGFKSHLIISLPLRSVVCRSRRSSRHARLINPACVAFPCKYNSSRRRFDTPPAPAFGKTRRPMGSNQPKSFDDTNGMPTASIRRYVGVVVARCSSNMGKPCLVEETCE